MRFKFVTFDCNQEQFLVKVSESLLDADANEKAIQEAIRANKLIGNYDDPEDNALMENKELYEVEDVDFDLLSEIIRRDDFMFRDGDVIAFSDM